MTLLSRPANETAWRIIGLPFFPTGARHETLPHRLSGTRRRRRDLGPARATHARPGGGAAEADCPRKIGPRNSVRLGAALAQNAARPDHRRNTRRGAEFGEAHFR